MPAHKHQELLDKPVISVNSRTRLSQWIELFYDLVFSVTIVIVADDIGTKTSFSTVMGRLLLFIPFWWIWVGHTMYTTRFAKDNIFFRLCTFCQMGAVAVMTIQFTTALGSGATAFALAYSVGRICLLLLYLEVWLNIPKAKPLVVTYLIGFPVGILCWIVSIWLPQYRIVLWTAGLLLDFAVPWVGNLRGSLKRIPVDTEHLPGRFGDFISIITGQLIFSLVVGIKEKSGNYTTLLIGLLAFCFSVCQWWIYTTFVQSTDFKKLSSGQRFVYGHLPLILSLVLLSVGVQKAIQEATQQTLSQETVFLLCSGAGLWLIGYWLVLALIKFKDVSIVFTAFIVGSLAALFILNKAAQYFHFVPLLYFSLFTGVFVVLLVRQLLYSFKHLTK